MKNQAGYLMIIIFLAAPVFAQNDFEYDPQNRHNQFDNYLGVSLGAGAMMMEDNSIYSADFGATYGFYAFKRLSINTGIFLHAELYSDINLVSGNEPMQAPLYFIIPFGIHFNIPKAEWLYAGINVCINFPLADLKSPGKRDAFTESNTFISMPIDLGVDLIKPGRGGSRILFRITPTFHNSETAVPVGIMWQIYNWKVLSKKAEVTVPPPPVIKIVR